jgi:hypothetical protein
MDNLCEHSDDSSSSDESRWHRYLASKNAAAQIKDAATRFEDYDTLPGTEALRVFTERKKSPNCPQKLSIEDYKSRPMRPGEPHSDVRRVPSHYPAYFEPSLYRPVLDAPSPSTSNTDTTTITTTSETRSSILLAFDGQLVYLSLSTEIVH